MKKNGSYILIAALLSFFGFSSTAVAASDPDHPRIEKRFEDDLEDFPTIENRIPHYGEKSSKSPCNCQPR